MGGWEGRHCVWTHGASRVSSSTHVKRKHFALCGRGGWRLPPASATLASAKWRSCAALARNVEAGCGTLPARGMLPWAPQRGEAAMPEELSEVKSGSYQTNVSEFRVTLYPCMQWSGCGWRHVGEALRCVDTRDSRTPRARSVGSRHFIVRKKKSSTTIVGNLEHLENAAASARSALAAGVPPTPHRQLLWGQQVRSQR